MMSLSRPTLARAGGQSLSHAEADDFTGRAAGDRIGAIIERCAVRHGVSVEALKGKGRTQKLVAARTEAIRLVAKCFPKISTPRLGKIFGGRDHTTILHALGRTAASQKIAAARTRRQKS